MPLSEQNAQKEADCKKKGPAININIVRYMCATSVLLPQEKRVLINIFHTVILLFNKNFDLCGIYYKKGRGFPIYSKIENASQ